MELALKNIVINLSQSLSSHCFTATLWINGQPAFDVHDEGFNEPMLYTPLPNASMTLNALLNHIQPPVSAALSKRSHYQHLDQAVTAMVDAHIVLKKTQHQLRRITFEHKQRLYELSNTRATDELAMARLKQSTWWTARHTVLNELPFEAASARLLAQQFKVLMYKCDRDQAPEP